MSSKQFFVSLILRKKSAGNHAHENLKETLDLLNYIDLMNKKAIFPTYLLLMQTLDVLVK